MPSPPVSSSPSFSPADFIVRSARLKGVNYKESDSSDESRTSSPEPAHHGDSFVRKTETTSRHLSSDEYATDTSSDADEYTDFSIRSSQPLSALSHQKRKRHNLNASPATQRLSPSNHSHNSPEASKPYTPPLKKQKHKNIVPIIKQEADHPALTAPKTYVLEEISHDRTLLSEEIIVCKIDDDGIPHFSKELKPEASYWIRRDWDKPSKDHHEVFPLQDFEYPGHVIKTLQDPQNPRYCMPGTQVTSVIMSPETRQNHMTLLRHRGKQYINSVIDRKERAIQERLQAIIDRSASSKRSFDTDTVVLDGKEQYGLRATEDISVDSPEIARQDWSYKGSMYDDSNKAEAEKRLLLLYGPRFREYVREIRWKDPLTDEKRTSYIAALGSGGYMHNANTVLKKKEGLDGYLDYDLPKINLAFEDYVFVSELPNGQIVANPHSDQAPLPDKEIKAGDGLFVCYGTDFLNMLRQKIDGKKPDKEVHIKQEELDDDTLTFPQYLTSILAEQTRPDHPLASPDRKFARARSNSLSSLSSALSSIDAFKLEEDFLSSDEAEGKKALSPLAKSLKAQLPKLTKAWEKASHQENAIAAAQMRIAQPKWSLRKIAEELKQQGISCSETVLHGWGLSTAKKAEPVGADEWEEAITLKKQLPHLTSFWVNNNRQRKLANTAAQLHLNHPEWSANRISNELKAQGLYVPRQTLNTWGISGIQNINSQDREEVARLKKALPHLTEAWVEAFKRKEANTAAGLHLQHPDWGITQISKELNQQGMPITIPTLISWGISKRIDANEQNIASRLKEQLPHLTRLWDNSKQRKEANAAAQLHLDHPAWSSSRISAELKAQGMDVAGRAIRGWGISEVQNITAQDLEEATRLKKALPYLTRIWVEAKKRKEANKAASVHLQHPDWGTTQISRELKKQEIEVAPTTLLSWGISPKYASTDAMEN